MARCQHLPAMPPRPTHARTHQTDGPRRLVANAISHTACRTHHGISALSHIAAGAALMCCAHYEEHCSVRCTAHRDSANRGNVPAATVVGSLSAETEKRGSIEMTSAFCSLTPRSLHFTSFTACDACRSCPKKCRKAAAQCGPGGNCPSILPLDGGQGARPSQPRRSLGGVQFERASPPRFRIVSTLLLSVHMSHLYFAEMGSKVEYSQ